MNLSLKKIGILVVLGWVGAVSADRIHISSNIQVGGIGMDEWGTGLVYLSSGHPSACVWGKLYVSLNSSSGKTAYATLLTAQAAGINVCRIAVDREASSQNMCFVKEVVVGSRCTD